MEEYMKRLTAIFLCLIMLICLCACDNGGSGSSQGSNLPAGSGSGEASTSGSSEDPGSDEPASGSADEEYVFVYGGVTVDMSSPSADTVSALGDALSYFESESCAGLGMERYYVFASFQLVTAEYHGEEVIYSVYFLDDTIATKEGAYLGMTTDQVTTIYGSDALITANQYVYTRGSCDLCFIFGDGILQAIEYRANDLVE